MKKISIKTRPRKSASVRPESYRKQLQTLLRRLVTESRTATTDGKTAANS